MTDSWQWWVGGPALAAIALIHWILLKRQMAVSGRLTGLVNRLRFGPDESGLSGATREDVVRALRAATVAEFGEDAPETQPQPAPSSAPIRGRQSPATHALFLASILMGGLASTALGSAPSFSVTLRGDSFKQMTGDNAYVMAAVLLLGGILVGFGTRMAAGCTSGHGLCGTSRLQSGSILATASFFGAGVATSLLVAVLR